MEPEVPFALLGTAQLLAVFAWTGLAAAALARLRAGGAHSRGAALLVLAGALVLVPDEIAPTLAGSVPADVVAGLRAAGLLLVGAGIALGALGRRGPTQPRRRTPDPTAGRPAALPAVALPGVVAPLAPAVGPAVLVAAAGLLAGAAAVRARRDTVGVLVGSGLVLAGAAGAGAAGQPVLALVLRIAAALLLLGALVLLARVSLLSQVVATILAGVLVMAIAAVGVVGTVVVRSYDAQARELVAGVAEQSRRELQQYADSRRLPAAVLRFGCPPQEPLARCAQVLSVVDPARDVAVRVGRTGPPVALASRGTSLSAVELAALRSADVVTDVLDSTAPGVAEPASGLLRLGGTRPSVAAVAVAPEAGRDASGRPTSVLVYLARLDDLHLFERRAAAASPAPGAAQPDVVSLLVDGQVVASEAPGRVRTQVRDAVAQAGAVPPTGAVVPSRGTSPTVGVLPLLDLGGTSSLAVAVSSSPARSLAAQRDALRALLLTALASTAAVSGLALLVGRHAVRPVRRLTAAAARVAAGDLSVRTGFPGRDEVAVLSRAFDVMTGSLSRATGDLRGAAARLEAVLAAMADGLVVSDRDGRVTGINRAALALTGLADEQAALGRPLADVVRVRTGEAADGELVDPYRQRQRHGAEGALERADGGVVPVRVELTDLEGGAGTVLVLQDRTREREVERMKSSFLSNVSHELRTPLTPIRGYAEFLAARPALAAEQVQTIAGTVLAEALKMNRVVDLLVDVAAIEAGRVQVRPRAVDPAALLEPRLAARRVRDPGRAADIDLRVAEGLPPVLVDPEWVGKALDELLDNALRHTPVGTTVVLGADPGPAGRVRVHVEDAGPGIAPADQQQLLSAFAQADGGATRSVGGLGLGLSFVNRLAQDAGYPLTLRSSPGQGACFALDLPVAAQVDEELRTAS